MSDDLGRLLEGIDLGEFDPWQEGARPWLNKEWERQGALLVPGLRPLFEDACFRAAWRGLVELKLFVLLSAYWGRPTLSPEEFKPMQHAALEGLAALAAEVAPIVAHQLGRDGLRSFLSHQLDIEASLFFGEAERAFEFAAEAAGQMALQHPGPDNPSTLLPSGDAIIPAEATEEHRRQVRDLQRARGPKSVRGAKKGSHQKRKREPGPPMLECERVYELRERWKLDWPDIYARLRPNGPEKHPSDTVEWGEKRYKIAARKLRKDNPEETPD
jgi:hypothetical protein